MFGNSTAQYYQRPQHNVVYPVLDIVNSGLNRLIVESLKAEEEEEKKKFYRINDGIQEKWKENKRTTEKIQVECPVVEVWVCKERWDFGQVVVIHSKVIASVTAAQLGSDGLGCVA